VNDTRGEGGVVDRVEMVGVMDGGEVEVEKALGGLRAVKIENPGKYEIVLRYEPLSVKIGAVMSLTGFLVFIVVLLINRKNFKKGLQR
jgi:uncharacterized membrane protein YfhO